jgi:futalosine hydrolase
MPKLLLVCATSPEVAPTVDFLRNYTSENDNRYLINGLDITLCITGAGMVQTAFELGRFEKNDFDFAVNLGVAGSFQKFSIGEVVNVTSDCFSELGAQDNDAFIRIDDLGLGTQQINPKLHLHSPTIQKLKRANAITVNTVHGREESINKVILSHHPDVESMEGASFFLAANSFKWKCAQIRAISNQVEKRNRPAWDLPLAIKNLNEVIIDLIKDLSHN